jgi:hypothetical protein
MKKIKSYSEADLIEMFGLENQAGNVGFPLMEELTSVPNAVLNIGEQQIIDTITDDLQRKINGWNEEMLKMNFIAFVILLGHLTETKDYKTYYESVLEATVEGYFLKVKADMMVAKGILEVPKMPFFYFQEYKKQKDPKGDVTAQLLEAFLIAQEKNKNGKPMYGCTVVGKYWEFLILENRTYCVSRSYDCTDQEDLLQIIAILRKFKEILETRLLN